MTLRFEQLDEVVEGGAVGATVGEDVAGGLGAGGMVPRPDEGVPLPHAASVDRAATAMKPATGRRCFKHL